MSLLLWLLILLLWLLGLLLGCRTTAVLCRLCHRVRRFIESTNIRGRSFVAVPWRYPR